MDLSEIIPKLSSLSKAIETYWDTELPKRHPDYPFVRAGEDSGPPPPEEKALRELFASLPDDAIYKLALILYLGRGDFGTDDLVGHYQALKERFESSTLAASQMMGKPLADYLADGVAELKKSGIDVDHLPLTLAHSGR
jgi:hypothetical protein